MLILFQLDTCLSSLPLNSKQIALLTSYIQANGSLSKIQSLLRGIIKNKNSQASVWARQSLHEMELLKKNLDALQVPLPVTFDMGLSLKYHEHYSGIIFQVRSDFVRRGWYVGLRHANQRRRSLVRSPIRSNRSWCRQQLTTAAMFLRSCVVQALSWEMDTATRYTLRRNIASIMKICFEAILSMLFWWWNRKRVGKEPNPGFMILHVTILH